MPFLVYTLAVVLWKLLVNVILGILTPFPRLVFYFKAPQAVTVAVFPFPGVSASACGFLLPVALKALLVLLGASFQFLVTSFHLSIWVLIKIYAATAAQDNETIGKI